MLSLIDINGVKGPQHTYMHVSCESNADWMKTQYDIVDVYVPSTRMMLLGWLGDKVLRTVHGVVRQRPGQDESVRDHH